MRRRSRNAVWGMTAWLLVSLSAPAVARTPKFPDPPDASLEWVSDDMSWNGIAMQVRRFESRRSEERVLEFYRTRWQRGPGGKPGYRESSAGSWRIISHLDDEHLLTVQVQPSGRRSCWGYLAVSNLPEMAKAGEAPEPGHGFPRMRGSQVTTDVDSKDLGKRGRTLHITNEFSLESNVSFYRDHYLADGWSSRTDFGRGRKHLLVFARGGGEVSLVISHQDGATAVVANSVERTR